MLTRVKGEGVFSDKLEFRPFGTPYLEADFAGGLDRDPPACEYPATPRGEGWVRHQVTGICRNRIGNKIHLSTVDALFACFCLNECLRHRFVAWIIHIMDSFLTY